MKAAMPITLWSSSCFQLQIKHRNSGYLCRKLPRFSWPPVARDTKLLRRKETLLCGSPPAWLASRRRTTVGERRAGGTNTVYALVSSSPRSRRSGTGGAAEPTLPLRPHDESAVREGDEATGNGRKLWQLLWRRWGWAVQDTLTSERADVVDARRGNPRRLQASDDRCWPGPAESWRKEDVWSAGSAGSSLTFRKAATFSRTINHCDALFFKLEQMQRFIFQISDCTVYYLIKTRSKYNSIWLMSIPGDRPWNSVARGW